MLMARFTSPVASGSVLPSSRVMSVAADVSWLSRISAALNRYSPRRGAGSAAHAGCAFSAAANAAATSSGPDAWNKPTMSSVFAGLMFEKVRWVLVGTH
jgi:hypothetical protein